MQGTISNYDQNAKFGVIRARSGDLFSFSKIDWSSEAGWQPKVGMGVVLEDEDRVRPQGYARKGKPANDLPGVAVC